MLNPESHWDHKEQSASYHQPYCNNLLGQIDKILAPMLQTLLKLDWGTNKDILAVEQKFQMDVLPGRPWFTFSGCGCTLKGNAKSGGTVPPGGAAPRGV